MEAGIRDASTGLISLEKQSIHRYTFFMETILSKFSRYSIRRLAGDGSNRCFFRLTTKGTSQVLMINPDRDSNERYLKAYNKYRELLIPVPEILDYSLDENFFIFEDLGDFHLKDRLMENGSPELLKDAVKIIVSLQYSNGEKNSYDHSFDFDMFTFESNYAFLHFCEELNNRPDARNRYQGVFTGINEFLAQSSTFLTHRDYHPDNILVRDEKLFIIDYQDTRLGPMTYDLVSLLYDRSPLDYEVIDRLKDYFLTLTGTPAGISKEEFDYLFSINSIQRMFKILGSFAHLSVSKKNPAYLTFIPQTLSFLEKEIKDSPLESELKSFIKDIS